MCARWTTWILVRKFGTLIEYGRAVGCSKLHFHSATKPSPKFATCRYKRERLTLELKLLTDISLVRLLVWGSNAGRSTIVRVADDRSVLGGEDGEVQVTVPVWLMTQKQLLKSGVRA